MLCFAGASVVHADDTFRCGTKLVTAGMAREQVISMCGEPSERKSEEVPQMVRNANGSMRQVGTVTIERWTYNRGSSQFPTVLEIQEGKVKSITLVRP